MRRFFVFVFAYWVCFTHGGRREVHGETSLWDNSLIEKARLQTVR